jgi:hypothetical protein
MKFIKEAATVNSQYLTKKDVVVLWVRVLMMSQQVTRLRA